MAAVAAESGDLNLFSRGFCPIFKVADGLAGWRAEDGETIDHVVGSQSGGTPSVCLSVPAPPMLSMNMSVKDRSRSDPCLHGTWYTLERTSRDSHFRG